ncbi:hypothetical protein VTP01DRAFT_4678 [Rhizomucor pusillus]|uniref:uncharacterized protein n=1 Tax=Rhizomucor pusillus TaxID=4840 RepID=UPI0037448E3F
MLQKLLEAACLLTNSLTSPSARLLQATSLISKPKRFFPPDSISVNMSHHIRNSTGHTFQLYLSSSDS